MHQVLEAIYAMLARHPVAVFWSVLGSVVLGYVASNIVSALPAPLPEQRRYNFVYKVLHGIFGNLPRVITWLRFGRSADAS